MAAAKASVFLEKKLKKTVPSEKKKEKKVGEIYC